MSLMGFFAGPASPPSPVDPYFANVVLLCHFEGENGQSADLGDNSPSPKTVVGLATYATITTSEKMFGSSCLQTDQSSAAFQGVRVADSVDWYFGAGSFTVELFVKLKTNATTSANRQLIGQYDNAANLRSWSIDTINGGLAVLRSADGINGFADIATSTTLSSTAWQHVATDYDAGTSTLRLYKDGVMIGKQVAARTLLDSTAPLVIGNRSQAAQSGTLNVFVDEVRITKGVARYASDAGYSVPTAPFPNQ